MTTSGGNLDDLAAFAVVARERSFTRAAAELRVSTSALSHRIKLLEDRLGLRLLQRNSRSVAVTEAGAELLQALEPALATIDHALGAVGKASDSLAGTLRLTMTRYPYETFVRPVLARFCRQHPRVVVEVLVDYQFRDIIADRFDAGVRLGDKLEKDMFAVKVGKELRMAVVAAPAYFAEHPKPAEPADLAAHRCINYRMMASGMLYPWELEREGRALEIKVQGPLTFNEPEMMIGAALDGLGLAYLMEDQIAPHLASGALVRCLEDWTPPFAGYFLYYPSRRQVTPVLAAFIDAVRSAAG
jgi:DNA-binding transcriptional LysR family regulator